MNSKNVIRTVMVTASLAVIGSLAGLALAAPDQAAQDRYTLTVPGGGLAFSDFKGYDTWQSVAVSETKTSVKAILANDAMIQAYKHGVPGNGKPFPEGSKVVKIEWLKKLNTKAPYVVNVPGTLKSLSFIEKDSKRFPNTHGWAYAQFTYDTASQTFKPSVTGPECGYVCHTRVASQDYTYTAYPPR
jgi:hypothetical protein